MSTYNPQDDNSQELPPARCDCGGTVYKRRGYQLVEDEGTISEAGEFELSESDTDGFADTFGEIGAVVYVCKQCGKEHVDESTN